MEWRGVTERPGFHEYLTWLNLIMDKVFFHGSESVYVCLCGADYRGGPCYLHRPDACCGTPLTWRLGEGRVLSLCFQIPPPSSHPVLQPLSLLRPSSHFILPSTFFFFLDLILINASLFILPFFSEDGDVTQVERASGNGQQADPTSSAFEIQDSIQIVYFLRV